MENKHKKLEENIQKILDNVLDPYTGKHKNPEVSINHTLFGDTLFVRKDLLVMVLWPIIYKFYELGFYNAIAKERGEIERIEPTEAEMRFMLEQEKEKEKICCVICGEAFVKGDPHFRKTHPHGDEDFSYMCGSEWCRCMQ